MKKYLWVLGGVLVAAVSAFRPNELAGGGWNEVGRSEV